MGLDFLKDKAGEGFENVGQQDRKQPYLTILADLSPQVKKQNAAYVPGAEPGMIFNTLTHELLGQKIQVVAHSYKTFWLEFKPDRGPLVAIHERDSIQVDKTDFSDWKYGENTIVETMYFFVTLHGREEEGIHVLPFKSTNIRYGKDWLNQMLTLREGGQSLPLYAAVWELTSTFNTDGKNEWFAFGVNKTAAIKFVEYITEDTYTKFVVPNREIVKLLTAPARMQEALPPPEAEMREPAY